ncbi:unnamed protein product [Symbiodinium sp. CCMP2592]|nr:unnamed protein product [Symbiodinium sp. CCMP2592]
MLSMLQMCRGGLLHLCCAQEPRAWREGACGGAGCRCHGDPGSSGAVMSLEGNLLREEGGRAAARSGYARVCNPGAHLGCSARTLGDLPGVRR